MLVLTIEWSYYVHGTNAIIKRKVIVAFLMHHASCILSQPLTCNIFTSDKNLEVRLISGHFHAYSWGSESQLTTTSHNRIFLSVFFPSCWFWSTGASRTQPRAQSAHCFHAAARIRVRQRRNSKHVVERKVRAGTERKHVQGYLEKTRQKWTLRREKWNYRNYLTVRALLLCVFSLPFTLK